jgi:2-polyprenyl-6-methoxyphenol hydroxylase-like FAD-dependent oxidoreductase
MYLPANSVRALDALGLGAPLRDRGSEIARQRFLDERGRMLLGVDLPAFWGAVGPCFGIGRQELHEVLREGIPVRLSTTVVALREEDERVHAVFDDGSTDDYDLVVGADGARSWVRVAACGGADPRFLGQVSWRFLVDRFPGLSAWTAWLGRDRGFLALPLGHGRTYCYVDIDAAAGIDPTAGKAAALTELFGRFAQPVPTMLAAGLAEGTPYFSPIEEVLEDRWVHGRIALVGDAAHAMSPNMAEGAGMALEDALVLAATISSGGSLEDFDARRRPRVAFVRAQTRRRDRTRRVPASLRNAALRYAGQWIFRSNYTQLLAGP